jgi:hypothetical protein
VFLAGGDPEGAGIKMGMRRFEETVGAIDPLLGDCEQPFLEIHLLHRGDENEIPILNGFVPGCSSRPERMARLEARPGKPTTGWRSHRAAIRIAPR